MSEISFGAMDQAPLILGSVTFYGHEVPSRIGVGGAHAVTIHRLPGGSRVIDAMGVDDGAISWSGFFTGPSAAARARLVDSMRQSGELVALSFSDYAFNVVVVQFEYTLQDRGALITYRIRTEIVPGQVSQTNDTSASLVTGLSRDIVSASSRLSTFGLSGGQTAVDAVQTALAGSGDSTSSVKLATLSVALQAAADAVQAIILDRGSTVAASAAGSSMLTSGADLTALTNSAGQLAGSVQAAAYVNRSNIWLDEIAGQSQGTPLISA